MQYPKDDEFELSFFDDEPEEEASVQELTGNHHAVFDWAAGGATDLMEEDKTQTMPFEDDTATKTIFEKPEEKQAPTTQQDPFKTVMWNDFEKASQPEPVIEPQKQGRRNNGHTVLISGGDRGIGAATVRLFWQLGYRTAFFYHTNEAAARALVNELGSDCVAVRCDVADRDACEAAWKVVQRTMGDPDVLICNAGIAQQKLFTDITEEDWQRMIGVDLTGVFHLCQIALPAMIRKKYGRILTVSSMWGQTGGSCEVHYSAAKAGVIGLTKALAKEEGPSGITVNCVAPGVVETDMMNTFTPEDKAALAEETPVQRLGTPQEIAQALAFLADEKSGFITGQVFGVNGGLVI